MTADLPEAAHMGDRPPELNLTMEMSEQPRRRRRRLPRWLRNLLLFLSGIAIAGGLCYSSVMACYRVDGHAMQPTLRDGDRVLALTYVYQGGGMPKRGSVVFFHAPAFADSGHQLIAKRVVGIPGDTIEVRQGRMYRNGALADEDYIREAMRYEWGPVTCPKGSVIVLGDNRNLSNDSHNWSLRRPGEDPMPQPFLPQSSLRGRIFFRIFPPHRMGLVKRPT